jgi:hypothetical protein
MFGVEAEPPAGSGLFPLFPCRRAGGGTTAEDADRKLAASPRAAPGILPHPLTLETLKADQSRVIPIEVGRLRVDWRIQVMRLTTARRKGR